MQTLINLVSSLIVGFIVYILPKKVQLPFAVYAIVYAIFHCTK